MTKIAKQLTELVGNTPLLELNKYSQVPSIIIYRLSFSMLRAAFLLEGTPSMRMLLMLPFISVALPMRYLPGSMSPSP